jgi:hypothetical protein
MDLVTDLDCYWDLLSLESVVVQLLFEGSALMD